MNWPACNNEFFDREFCFHSSSEHDEVFCQRNTPLRAFYNIDYRLCVKGKIMVAARSVAWRYLVDGVVNSQCFCRQTHRTSCKL